MLTEQLGTTVNKLFSDSDETNYLSKQTRQMILIAIFIIIYAVVLTLSPAIRTHSWNTPLRWDHWLAVGVWGITVILITWQFRRLNIQADPYLVPLAAFLSGWGIMTIYRLFPDLGIRQSLWLLIGSAVLLFGLKLSPVLGFLQRYKYLWLSSGLVLMALTLLFGSNPLGDGPRLWLGCCGFYFQPSEPLKLLLIIYLAAYLADRYSAIYPDGNTRTRDQLLQILAPTIVLSGLVLALLVVQRDLGTALIFLFLFTAMTYVATGQYRIPIMSLGLVLILGLLGYFLFDLVRIRMDAWLIPWQDQLGRSYQIVQSLFAIANGGFFGRGPGLGSPTLVPVSHSDFIFSAITEEFGLIGAIGMLLILGLLGSRGLQASIQARSSFHRFLAVGLTTYLVGQSILIIAGNIRVLPLTGVTLPFVSYGGSSLITSFIALLLLVQVSRQDMKQSYPLPNRQPLLSLSLFLGSGLIVLSLATGWWTIIRSDELNNRQNNPRRYINDLFSQRGSLLDRSNSILSETVGYSGSYERFYRYPDLGPILGYTNPLYGQSGLEFSLDDYLRGVQGNPQSTVWSYYLLYGQHPPGLDIRLSIDENLQTLADEELMETIGSVILLDTDSGEILVMASHPTFDANNLSSTWDKLIIDDNSPLLNRATLGSYQPGTALGPLWFAAYEATGLSYPDIPTNLSVRVDDKVYTCAQDPMNKTSWASVIAAGCPAASDALVQALVEADPQAVQNILTTFGLFSQPQLRMPVSLPSQPNPDDDLTATSIGQSSLQVNPLQISLAAASLSNLGVLPSPRIALAVDTAQSGWVVLPPLATPTTAISQTAAQQATEQLKASENFYWETLARALNGDNSIIWYLAGTVPSWNGTPLSLVVMLEEDNPVHAKQIGQKIIETALAQR